ncbi:unnamed protein product [Ilex paraguariensis]|uniref:Uncharacterized protein n=1 Tax=Ilex paraguariensis TaxID=185542 RepID=A0ABC8SQT4_9AQUA
MLNKSSLGSFCRVVFAPLWSFHVVVARGRFSLPAPSRPLDRHWAPCHAIMATPLLVAFELLLCIYLEDNYAVNLKIVFLPLLAFETAILIDNVRMCRALMPGDEDTMSDEAIWETLPNLKSCLMSGAITMGIRMYENVARREVSMFWSSSVLLDPRPMEGNLEEPLCHKHFWVAISMVFFIAATTFTLLKLSGVAFGLGIIQSSLAYLLCVPGKIGIIEAKIAEPPVHHGR